MFVLLLTLCCTNISYWLNRCLIGTLNITYFCVHFSVIYLPYILSAKNNLLGRMLRSTVERSGSCVHPILIILDMFTVVYVESKIKFRRNNTKTQVRKFINRDFQMVWICRKNKTQLEERNNLKGIKLLNVEA